MRRAAGRMCKGAILVRKEGETVRKESRPAPGRFDIPRMPAHAASRASR